VEYLMPAYVCLALLLGAGLGVIVALPAVRSASSSLALLMALVIYLAMAQAMAHYPSFALLHRDRSARTYAEEILQAAPPRAVILANWHHATSLRYLQMVEGQRLDVTIRYVHPRGSTSLPDLWLHEIDQYPQQTADGVGAVIVTNLYPQFETSPYRFRPLGEAFLVVRPADAVDMQGTGVETRSYTPLHLTLDHMLELVGFDLEERTIDTHQPLVLLLAWQPLASLEQDVSFFVHLVGADGVPVAQADTRHTRGRYQPGKAIVDRYTLFLRPTAPPGSYTLVAGAYIPLAGGGWKRLSMPDGADHVALAKVEVRPPSQAPITLHPRYQPFAGGATLVGVDYDTSYAHSRRVYLHWHVQAQAAPAQALLLSEGQLCSSPLLPGIHSQSTYLSTACDIPAEVSSLRMELRRASDGGLLSPLGPWHLPRRGQITLPPVRAGSRYVSLGGEMVLVDARITLGRQVSTRLDFVALSPLTHDYSLSLRLRDVEGGWQAQQDGTPSWGAIPTLKWIRGTRVTDVRRISPPAGAQLGQLQLELLAYEAFTLAPLPPLDERLLAQGPMIPLGNVEVRTPP